MFRTGLTRRGVLAAGAAAAGASLLPWTAARAAGTVNFADIGVGDPNGDWSKYTAASGYNVNLVSIGNAPSAILNVLVASGGQGTYDIINIVGGMQKPLVENDLVEKIDTSKLPNWAKDSLHRRVPRQGQAGLPVHRLQRRDLRRADRAAGRLLRLSAGEDRASSTPTPRSSIRSGRATWRSRTTTRPPARRPRSTSRRQASRSIGNPDDMTKEEFKTVIDFLIEQKKKGQFRVIWNSFEQAVNLIVNKEVYVIDCWEPMVFVAKSQGRRRRLCRSQGRLPAVGDGGLSREEPEPQRRSRPTAAYQLLDFMLGGWYGATHHQPARLHDQPAGGGIRQGATRRNSRPTRPRSVAEITENVKRKFQQGGTWQNRWPTEVEFYESEWSRFKAA